MGYLPEMWHDFGVAVAGLAGALTGLTARAPGSGSAPVQGVPDGPRVGGPHAWH